MLLQHYAEYYRVLLQYYPVLQSITPVLPRAPECYTSSVGSAGVRAPATPALGDLSSWLYQSRTRKKEHSGTTGQSLESRPGSPAYLKGAEVQGRGIQAPQSNSNTKGWGNLVPICQGAGGVVVSHLLSMREALGSIPIAAVVHCGVLLCSVSAYSRTIKSWALEFLIHSGFLCPGAEGHTQVHR